MSLQTDLHQAVAQVTADSALLHTIVHGTTAQTVTTEGGAVATVAKGREPKQVLSDLRPTT